MKVKRTLFISVLILTLSLAMGLSGWQSKALASDGKKVTITLWHIYGPEMKPGYDWFKKTIANFEKQYPNIHVEEEITPNDPYKVKFRTALQAGEAADALMTFTGGWLETYAKSGYILPIDKYLDQGGWRDSFMPGGFDPLIFDGKTYGLPVNIRTVHIWYNKDVFKKYNLKPAKTMSELKEIIKTLRKNGVTPFSLGNKERWQGHFWTNYMFARVGGYEAWANAVAGKGMGWADPSHVKALGMLQDLVKMGAFTEGFNGVGAMDVNNAVFTGDAAMILNGSFFIMQVMSLAPKGFLDNTLGYFNFPLIEGGKGTIDEYHGGVAPAFAINAASKHPDEVATFYRFMFKPENMKIVAKNANWVTVVKGSSPQDAQPLLRAMNSEVDKMKRLVTYSDFTWTPEAYQIYADTTQAVLGLEITPEEAVKRMEKAARTY